MASQAEDSRLSTWAEIAAYIGRDVRTARRYESERGLPVRRLPGARSTVFALRSELDAWLRRRGNDGGEPSSPSRPTADPRPPGPGGDLEGGSPWWRTGAGRAWVAAGAVLALVLAGGGALALHSRLRQPPTRPDVLALYQQGLYAWSRRTPEGLERAIDAFTQAVVRDPGYAPAYAGLADAYDLAPEFGRLSPGQAYPRAKSAAERALALDPSSAAAHRALAFVEFWWEGRVSPAMAEFRRALELDPRSAQTHHWYANALAARGDPRALSEIDAAAVLTPSTRIMADRAWVLVMLRRPAEALAALDELTRLDPAFPSGGSTYVLAARRLGREADMLAAMRRWAEVRGDGADVAAVERVQAAYARGGRPALVQALADREESRLAQGRGDPITAAAAETERGRSDAAIALLRRAQAERSPSMLSLAVNPDFARLRTDPRFRSLEK